MTFRFGNDETLETRTLAILPVGIAVVNGVLRVCGAWVSAALVVEGFFKRPWLPRGHLFFEKLGGASSGDK